MINQTPEGCVPLQNRVDNLTFQWHQLQDELAGADPSDVIRIRNLVGAKERELQSAKAILQACIDNPPPPPPCQPSLRRADSPLPPCPRPLAP